MSFGRELKDFAEGFQGGWKMGAMADYYGGRGKGGGKDNPYSDEVVDRKARELAGIEEPGFFDRVFGGKEAVPLDPDMRNRARLAIAEGRGIASEYEAMAKNADDFKRMRSVGPSIAPPQKFALGGVVGDTVEGAQDAELDPALRQILDDSRIAIDDGMKAIQNDLTGGGALPQLDPERVQAYARSEGRAADEDIAAVEKAVDPDGTLPEGYRAPARMALVHRYYTERGEPEAATSAVKQMLLYDKFATQALGNIAVNALKNGQTEAGLKMLTDGYKRHDYDGRVMVASLDTRTASDAGGPVVNVAIKQNGKTVEEIKATPQQVAQVAQRAATGDAFFEGVSRVVAEAQKIRAERAAAGRGGRGGRAAPESKSVEGTSDFIARARGGAPGPEENVALPENPPMPPRRGEDGGTPEQKIDAAVAQEGALPEAPLRPALQPGLSDPRILAPADDADMKDAMGPVQESFRSRPEVSRGRVNDDFGEALPAPPPPLRQLPPVPGFSLDQLSSEMQREFESFPKAKRDQIIKDWNASARAENDRRKALNAEEKRNHEEAVKNYKAEEKRVLGGYKPKVLDAETAEKIGSGIDAALKERLDKVDAQGRTVAENYDKIPAHQRDTMREIGVALVASNPNMTSGSAAANVLSLVRLDQFNPNNVGFQLVQDDRTGTTYARFPDGRTLRVTPEVMRRIATIRSELYGDFKKRKDRETEEIKRSETKQRSWSGASDTVQRGLRSPGGPAPIGRTMGTGMRNLVTGVGDDPSVMGD